MTFPNESAGLIGRISRGAELVKSLDVQSSGFFDDLRALLDIVTSLSVAQPGPALRFSLADPGTSAQSLSDYLEGGIARLPATIAVYEAQTVAELAELSGSQGVAMKAKDMAAAGDTDSAKISACDELVSRHVKVDYDVDRIVAALESSRGSQRKLADDPTYKALHDEITALNDRIRAESRQLLSAVNEASRNRRDNLTDENSQIEADAIDAYNQCRKEYDANFARLKREIKKREAAFNKEKKTGDHHLFEQDGGAIISAVMAASPISEEEATSWAQKQTVDPAAAAKLKRDGYALDALRQDMADFYRITGGKCSAIYLTTNGRGRASASGIETRTGDKIVNIGTRFDRTVLFHELAHHLENDPIAKAAANGYLLKRREGSRLHRLRDLTKCDYKPSEVAYKDSFIDPYIGKVYEDGATEVFSMGLQYLANPKSAAILAAYDSHMLDLMTGYLSRPLSPAMSAKLHMHEGVISDKQDKAAQVEQMYSQAFSKLSGSVSIASDDWWQHEEATGSQLADGIKSYVLYRTEAKYVGRASGYAIFAGTFKNRNTKRNSKGFMVVDVSGEFPRSIPDYQAVHGGIDTVKAMIAIALSERANYAETGIRPNLQSIFYRYFSNLRDKRLISAAGQLDNKA